MDRAKADDLVAQLITELTTWEIYPRDDGTFTMMVNIHPGRPPERSSITRTQAYALLARFISTLEPALKDKKP